ncbi:MAG: hypothetical protein Kow0056_09790 [Coriobacteriia bacterium]
MEVIGARKWRALFIVAVCASVAILVVAAAPALGVEIETEGTVFKEKCNPCHGRIAESRSSEIIFSHAYHVLIDCSSCHTQFPHRPEGTQTPKMRECWNCHGLFHGPMGELATGQCDQCHRTPREDLRPEFHTRDWAEAPHVEPGRNQLQTLCMMCHDQAWCEDCHEDEDIVWIPDQEYAFDTEDGCLACHANEGLTKASAGGIRSFQVTGLEDSAHRDLTCQQCHPDFKYVEGLDATNLWDVNAGLACMGCHERDETKQAVEEQGELAYDSEGAATSAGLVDAYRDSVHGQELAAANYDAATCSSCHGGHAIKRLDTEAAQREIHQSAYRVCARCHLDEWESFDDYYHGAAYKAGAPDAPACWDCHGDHYILPSSDPKSYVSDEHKPNSCGGDYAGGRNCHADSTEQFVEQAGDLIHQKQETRQENPLRRFFSNLFGWLS